MPINLGITASRSRISPFRLHRPTTIEAACDVFRRSPGAVVHAGGIDLVNRMKAGLDVSDVIALEGVSALKGVRRSGDDIEIGAATRHWDIEHDPILKSALPAIPEFMSGLGNVRIRMQGTIGGNIMAGEPGYEMLPLLAMLDAQLVFASDSGQTRRIVPARAWNENLQAGELLVAISVPVRPVSVAWDRTLRPALGLVAALCWQDRTVVSGWAALTGQGAIWRSLQLDTPLSQSGLAAATKDLTARWVDDLPDIDVPGGPDRHYCRRVAGVMLRRALERMVPP